MNKWALVCSLEKLLDWKVHHYSGITHFWVSQFLDPHLVFSCCCCCCCCCSESLKVIVHVESRTEDLLEAGKVAFEALGEGAAAAGMKGASGSGSASEGINLELHLAPGKVDACRRSHPSPELWVDTGIMR